MVAPRVDGLGSGVRQPQQLAGGDPKVRADKTAAAKYGVNPARRSGPGRAAEETETIETTGWETGEQAIDQHETASLARRGKWDQFKGARGEAAPFERYLQGELPKGFLPPPRQPGEPPLNYFMRFSAALNEFYRQYGERLGISQYAFKSEDNPTALARQTQFRRRFDLHDPLDPDQG